LGNGLCARKVKEDRAGDLQSKNNNSLWKEDFELNEVESGSSAEPCYQ